MFVDEEANERLMEKISKEEFKTILNYFQRIKV
jgi:hypothetical protein